MGIQLSGVQLQRPVYNSPIILCLLYHLPFCNKMKKTSILSIASSSNDTKYAVDYFFSHLLLE